MIPGLSVGTCSNGFDLLSWLQASPLGRGRGLQKPQFAFWKRKDQAKVSAGWGSVGSVGGGGVVLDQEGRKGSVRGRLTLPPAGS